MCWAAERENTKISLRQNSAHCYLAAESATFIVCRYRLDSFRDPNGIHTKGLSPLCEVKAILYQSSFSDSDLAVLTAFIKC